VIERSELLLVIKKFMVVLLTNVVHFDKRRNDSLALNLVLNN